MNPETIQLIDKFAAKLGTTADHLWAMLLRQAKVEAVESVVVTLLLLGLVLGFARTMYRWWKKKIGYGDDGEDIGRFIASIAYVVLVALTLIFIFGSISSVVTAVANPEYFAFREITKALGK